MTERDLEPDDEQDETPKAAAFPELARYHRADVYRVYELRPVKDGAELWRITSAPDCEPAAIRETTLRSTEEAVEFLEEIERTLRAGGWKAV